MLTALGSQARTAAGKKRISSGDQTCFGIRASFEFAARHHGGGWPWQEA
jgi:hypothetical protein